MRHMHHYQVTFHSNSSESLKTVIEGFSIDEVEKEVHMRLFHREIPYRFPSMDGEVSYFTVIPQHVSFIEYKLLKKVPLLKFDVFLQLDLLNLQKVIGLISDNELLAKALKIATEETRDRFFSAMTSNRKVLIQDAEEAIGSISRLECEEAQRKMIDIVIELEKNCQIVLSLDEED